MKKAIKIILIIIILIFTTLLIYNNISKENELKQKDKEIENLKETINKKNQALVLEEKDGQIFIMKPNGITYCNLGKDSNGNVIETIANKDECILTAEICSILKSNGTTLNKENPSYLSKCE